MAIHILTLLAVFPAEALTSAFISGSVQTHPVVIRRILGRLRAAGFVKAMQGPGGGFALAVDPGSLTLRQVYEQLADRTVIAVHGSTNPECPVARNIGALLGDVISGAEQAMLDSFEDITIAGLAGRVAKREKAC